MTVTTDFDNARTTVQALIDSAATALAAAATSKDKYTYSNVLQAANAAKQALTKGEIGRRGHSQLTGGTQ